MVYIFEDECSSIARAKHAGQFAAIQHEEANKWAQKLAERVRPIEESSVSLSHRLHSRLDDGCLALVTGAGISMSCGLPSWPALVNEAAQVVLRQNGLTGDEIASMLGSVSFADDLLSLSQALTALTDESDLAAIVASRLYANESKSSRLLDSLVVVINAALASNRRHRRPTVVLTFNYDILLEEALKREGVPVESVGRNTKIDDLYTESVHVIHAHGMLGRNKAGGSNIVFTEQSYGDAYLGTSKPDPLSSLLDARFTLLFVGFSFRDRFVRQILHAHSLKRGGPVAVGLLSDIDLFDASKLQVASSSELGFSPNDEVGWTKSGRNPMHARNSAIQKIPERLARWILYSIGVEWLSADDREMLPDRLAKIAVAT